MLAFVLPIVIIVVFWFVFIRLNRFDSIGETTGVVTKVTVELDDSVARRKRPHSDHRMYRAYIQYEWEGIKYTAESWRAYQNMKYFPGDTVTIKVGKKDKGVVDIVR